MENEDKKAAKIPVLAIEAKLAVCPPLQMVPGALTGGSIARIKLPPGVLTVAVVVLQIVDPLQRKEWMKQERGCDMSCDARRAHWQPPNHDLAETTSRRHGRHEASQARDGGDVRRQPLTQDSKVAASVSSKFRDPGWLLWQVLVLPISTRE